jgi:hypothetical protein
MTVLITKQLTIIFYMCACGLCAGLVLDIFKIFVRRFFDKNTLATIITGIIEAIVIAYLIEEYLFFCQNGKVTFVSIVSFFVGLLLWYKYFYDIISLGDENEQKRKETS